MKKTAEARTLLEKIDGLRQKIAGKSIPDEKFVARKAKGLLNGSSTMVFGFLELGGNIHFPISVRLKEAVSEIVRYPRSLLKN